MMISSMRTARTALVLSAAMMALSACNGGGGGGGGPDSDRFFGQTFGAAPNTTLGEFIEDAEGERISITQHTGSMTLSLEDAEEIVEFLFFDGPLPDLAEDATVAATADGSDENPAHFRVTDTEDNDFIFRIASTGDLEMVVENVDPEGDGFFLAETIDDDPDVGDDVAALVATTPGAIAPFFGTLNYMSAVAWVTTAVPADDATEIPVDFGLGHMGLATPEADIPTTGTADYSGEFVGLYVVPGDGAEGIIAEATGDALFTADFGDATVEGGVSGIELDGFDLAGDAFFVEDAGGIDFDEVTISGNTFTGGVVPAEGGFAEFDADSIGTLDGTFYGPVEDGIGDTEGSAEAGAVLTLEDAGSDAFITGVIGATLDD